MKFLALLLICYSTLVLSAFPQTLDYGLFWVGLGNNLYKAVPGVSNPAYNPTKPTFIICHGWQLGTVIRSFRPTLNYATNEPSYGVNINEADSWILSGWNVGMIQWSQFGDELEVKDAEAKIWTPSGPQGMRWKKYDGTYATDSYASTRSVTQLAVEAIKNNMNTWSGNNLRLAGHSLGAQLAINIAKSLSDQVDSGVIPPRFRPVRVALLDHFFSQDGKSYLNGQWTGAVGRSYVSQLKTKGVLFETYRYSATSSNGVVGDENVNLNKMTVFNEMKPWYIAGVAVDKKHIAAFDLYVISYAYSAPGEFTWGLFSGYTGTGKVGAYASTSDSRLREMELESSCRYKRIQIDSGQSSNLGQGVWTALTNDDNVEKKCW